MNQATEYEELLAIRWIRELSEAEQGRLARLFALEEAYRGRWNEDIQLLEATEALPDVPVASNFTSLVVNRLAKKMGPEWEAAQRAESRTESHWLRRLGWGPMLGFGAVAFGGILVFFSQFGENTGTNMVESLAAVTEAGTVPTVEELQHFEAIQLLAQVPVDVDWELISASE